MKLCRVKVQANSLNADIRTFGVVCNQHPCAFVYPWAILWALDNGCCLVVFTPGNLKFRTPAVRFLTTHGQELARHRAFRPIAISILDAFGCFLNEKEMWILLHHCHNHQKFERSRTLGRLTSTFSTPNSLHNAA